MKTADFAPFLLVTLAAAQGRTWVVDADNRLGTDFTTLAAAFTAASDGDVLRVRAASRSYEGSTGKALTLLGEGGRPLLEATSTPALAVSGLGAGKRFSIRGFQVNCNLASCSFANNAGSIHVEDVIFATVFGLTKGTAIALDLQDCALVSLHRCQAAQSSCARGTLVLTDTSFQGIDADSYYYRGGQPGLQLQDAKVFVSGGSITGGAASYNMFPPRPGLVANNSTVTAGGSLTIRAGSVGASSFPAPAISANGLTALFGPMVSLITTPSMQPIVGSANVTRRMVAGLTVSAISKGRAFTSMLSSGAGDSFVVVLGLPQEPVAIFDGLLMLEALTGIPLGGGVQGASGQTTLTTTVPDLAALVGLKFVLQAGNFDVVTSTLGLSSPVVAIVQ